MLSNSAISDQFNLLSKLMDIHQENTFKSKSYSAAAFAIDKLPLALAEIPKDQIAGLKGIGESSAKKIIELLETSKLASLEELIAKTPAGILEMMQIKGLGPKKISTIWKEMGIETIGELLYACQENRLLLFKGFGAKTQQNVAEAIEFFMRHQGHFLYAEVETYAYHVQEVLQKNFAGFQFSLTGDFARQMPTIENLEWTTNIPKENLGGFLAQNGFSIAYEEDQTKAIGEEQVQLVFKHCSLEQFSTHVFFNSCSSSFAETWLHQFPQTRYCSTEEQLFASAGISYLPPYLREDPSWINKTNYPFSDIIQTGDIRGIIHSHSDWSDGTNTIEEMAKACIEMKLEYLVISDHSKSAFYANGLNEERIKAQHQYIDELNRKYAPFRIFKSIECDILNDGTLDYADNTLSTFDLVIASVHSNLKMSEEKAMQRLIAAIENPYTTILGHPTGRLLLSRKGYPVDHEKIIDACVANNVVIEINAHPRRLDLDWTWISKAQEKGALLSINPDAHHIGGFADTKYGVLAAQKGGLLKQRNLSSFTLRELEAHLS
jgi:DNA polymerase (family 10)